MMQRLYFSRDLQRGPEGVLGRLEEEIKELKEAIQIRDKVSIEEEMADVYAWLSSLANILDVDLEHVAQKKYDGACPKCTTVPCKCPFIQKD